MLIRVKGFGFFEILAEVLGYYRMLIFIDFKVVNRRLDGLFGFYLDNTLEGLKMSLIRCFNELTLQVLLVLLKCFSFC